MKRLIVVILMIPLMVCPLATWARETNINGDVQLSGSWITAADAQFPTTLMLYPDDAFRLHVYNPDKGITALLEGTRVESGNTVTVTNIRIGKLDEDGVYQETNEGEGKVLRYTFTLVEDDTLTLTDSNGVKTVFYHAEWDEDEFEE